MPLVLITFVLAIVLGFFAPRRVAVGVTSLAAVGTLIAFTWAVADGRGNDPWWLLIIAGLGGLIAIFTANSLSRARTQPGD